MPTRILIYGVTGSGKTTLAEQVGERLGLPWHSVDDLTWEPGWIPVPPDIQRARIAAICRQDRWVLDTAYGTWRDIPLATTELVIGLDLPRWVSLGRLVRRSVRRLVTRGRVCNGNRESIKVMCSADSIIVWHFKSFKRKQRRMREWHADPQAPRVLLFRSTRAVATWLDGLPRDEAR